jgi:hypothetical protein
VSDEAAPLVIVSDKGVCIRVGMKGTRLSRVMRTSILAYRIAELYGWDKRRVEALKRHPISLYAIQCAIRYQRNVRM